MGRLSCMATSAHQAASAPASNVVQALALVMADLPAIGKDSQASQQQGGYAYRGIEQITVHTQSLFARHGIVFTPHVRSYEIRDLVVNGKPWTDVVEMVEYTVYGPGGIEDHITVGPILAIGRDNTDKGGNKCLTQAFKYALLQALCISDAKDDGDTHTHEAEIPPTPEPVQVDASWVSQAERDAKWTELRDATAARGTDDVKKALRVLGFKKGTFSKEHAEQWEKLLPPARDRGPYLKGIADYLATITDEGRAEYEAFLAANEIGFAGDPLDAMTDDQLKTVWEWLNAAPAVPAEGAPA